MARSLKLIRVPSDVWAQIMKKLPLMKYQIPDTGNVKKFITPSLSLLEDSEDKAKIFLAVTMSIKSTDGKKCIFYVDYLIENIELTHCVTSKGNFANELIECVVKQLANEISEGFTILCKKIPWSVIYKLTGVVSKVNNGRNYIFSYMFNKDWRKYDWKSKSENITADAAEDIFWFAQKHFSEQIIQPEDHHYSSTILYLIHGILARTTQGLSTLDWVMSLTPIEKQKEFMQCFRSHIREVGLLSYFYLKMQDELKFIGKNSHLEKHMHKDDWKYMEKQFNHFWENAYNDKLAKVVKLFNDMVKIIQERTSH